MFVKGLLKHGSKEMSRKTVKFPDPDAQLMLKFKDGDIKSFEKLMEKYQKLVINTAYRLIGDKTEAEDIAQEVFLNIYSHSWRYKPQAKFSTWLFKITRNICLNRLRGKRRHPTVSLDSPIKTEKGEIARDIPDKPQVVADAILEKKEIQALIKDAIDSLPLKQRMAVILAKYDNLPYQEIARIMGCSVIAIKLRLHRAKAALKERLTPYLEKK